MSDVGVRVHAPAASAVDLVRFDETGTTELGRARLERRGAQWVGQVAAGTVYGLVAADAGVRSDPSKVLLDPAAREVLFPAGFSRRAAARHGVPNSGRAPLAVARSGPPARPSRRSTRPPVVYEVHVRGFTRRRGGPGGGTFAGVVADLDRLTALGVTVIELMPVHQNDPDEGSYWGYMPLAFGAVHRQYAATDDAWGELGDLVAAAHQRDIEVWLDVVFNHTTEIDETGPTYHFRGLADGDYYALDGDGGYIETSGCGNDIDTSSAPARDIVIESLERFADAGIDGFRFDLAPVVVRHRPFVAELEAWADRRGVRMIAEPWDASGDYLLGAAWPGRGWLQWNDRFRDDVRGYLRAESNLVPTLVQRVQGSPDLLDAPLHSVNFLSCHDGFTLYDMVAYDRKHNEANGQRNRDGAGDNRSWNCGWEGDDDVPEEVLALRRRQLRNAWCVLAMSHGVPMVAMGDEFGRTQRGNNNAYNQDNEISWVDWERRDEFADLERFVAELLALRARHTAFARADWWGDDVTFYGAKGPVDTSRDSRSLAWCIDGLYVITNSWWEPVPFWLQAPGPWTVVVDTAAPPPLDIGTDPAAGGGDIVDAGSLVTVEARSVVILER